ncbi:DUF1559 family PulG-like putative transporter [Schlesneria paludicola]|uniref:DUF1559 family PulG-like putative transporter n=1 Tax=Schlesneria paludicola TaxID=360056 RepID=UPI00029B5000|nr:DUF1559 domain-containing protein [Schlesneria paludicola]
MRLRRIDVVVSAAVIVVLLVLLVPAIVHTREAARRTQSKSNLKQLGGACFTYHEHFKCLPAGGTFDSDGRGYHGWMTQLLWYLDQNDIGNSLDWSQPWDSSRNSGHLLTPIPGFEIPGEQATAGPWAFPIAHYSANAHLLDVNSAVSFAEIDSEASQFLAAERYGDFVPWASPYNFRRLTTLNGDPGSYGHYSRKGCQFLYVDGHVDFVANDGFSTRRESLSGPDLVGFNMTTASLVRTPEFLVPIDALRPASIRLQSSRQSILAQRDVRGDVIRVESTDSNPKHGQRVTIHDADLTAIIQHRELQDLNLDGDFTDAGLVRICVLSKLTRLQLKSDYITEAGLLVLDQFPQLKEVRVEGSHVTDEIRDRLRIRRPACRVQPESSQSQ